jgi:hypothetical protein
MKVNLMPKTELGKYSLVLIVATPILFVVGSTFADSLYNSVSAGSTIWEDVARRPALALTMLMGMTAGISAFVVGFLAIVRQKERALSVYVATLLGSLLILFLISEVLFPH